ncbi:hypothetical protein CBW56_09305 [Denitratisoma oestradiolicum]|nr:hypothetical protein CBW56_09305 [Denitratisoma oestradiolicum]
MRLVGAIGAILVFAWAVTVVWTVREEAALARSQARALAMSVNQLTMANLLFMKVTKTIKKRSIYYDQVRQSEAVKDLRVIRGEKVIHEMGDGDETAMNPDDVEQRALTEGKPIFEETTDPNYGHVMRVVFPAIASKNYLGKDCLECHEEVKEGDIMGAVSMKISLTSMDEIIRAAMGKLVAAAVVLSAAMLAFIYVFVRRVVTRPMNAMASGLKDIAQGEGDLTRRLPVKGRDEIGMASESFNAMMEKLRSLIISVHGTVEKVVASSRDLGEMSHQVARSSQSQTDKSQGAAQALEQISQSIASVAGATGEVDGLARVSQERTSAGMATLTDFKHSVAQLESAVSQIAATVESFVHKTATISTMTQEVKDIADQTNLLALNAAIEAARAGEHGRGFAVVADEVRKLAEKSARSANEIDGITHSLNQESDQVSQAIGRGQKALAGSHDGLLELAGILEEVTASVDQVAQGMSGIRGATEEQRLGSAHATDMVSGIADLAEENDRMVDSMNDSVRNLTQLAQALDVELQRFKV